MNNLRPPIVILIADDDPDDRLMAKQVFEENRLANVVRFVVDGEDLMDYLHCLGKYTEAGSALRPGLILIDLNMPKRRIRSTQEIKADPELRQIPVIVLTTSKAEEDILRTYDLGANSFITKPVSFTALAEVMKTLTKYWFEIVELPSETNISACHKIGGVR